jgi:hypothetical protein
VLLLAGLMRVCPNRWPESAAARIVIRLAFLVCGELSALVDLRW